ncbi:UbiX family flavin prenyltransferase [Mariniblastus sp.]|jgi:flavin prenyltransferase|nr:flavin prenyltransferase UbiX [Mariniblastus sp.]MDB4670549.1 UbiX family flavin prenyltransferase [Pirellulaceae bacterium]MDB4755980.1 UbiX family flavin prenyltransferase [Mariniblastus sp.]
MKQPLVIAMTGASGAPYAVRLLEVLLNSAIPVHLTISPAGAQVIEQEMNLSIDLEDFNPRQLVGDTNADSLIYHNYRDYFTPIASGSFRTGGMVVTPCSGSTLSGIAVGASSNLIQRAADVHLKERRKLILVTRETPLSLVHIENMKKVTEAGAVVLPAMPGWYHGVESMDDLINFVVSRILDQLEIENDLIARWASREGI